MGRRITRAAAKEAARGLPEEMQDDVDKCTHAREAFEDAEGGVGTAADLGDRQFTSKETTCHWNRTATKRLLMTEKK